MSQNTKFLWYFFFFSGAQGASGGVSTAESPKEVDEISNAETEAKEPSQKMQFCEIQWQKVTELMKTRKSKKKLSLSSEKSPDEKLTPGKSPEDMPSPLGQFVTAKKIFNKNSDSSPVQVWNR